MDLARMAFDQAWQLTTLVVVAWVTARIVARSRPHLAYVLWLVVLLKAVTPPVWSSPTGIFSWVQASNSHDAGHVLASSEAIDDLRPSNVDGPLPAPHEQVGKPAVEPMTVRTSARLTLNSTEPNSSFFLARQVLGGLAVIWCGGLLGTLFVTWVRWSKCVYLLRNSPACDRPDLADMVIKLSRQLRVRRRVRLLVTSSRVGPAVIGLFRPLIVLPAIVVQGKRADELEAIIAHELLHVRRGDLWLGLLQVCAKAVWWFHPLVWWASRLSTQEAERCCDEEVIGELRCDPKRYARSLLDVLELKRTLRTVPAFPGMKPVEVTLQRLERIMRLGQGCHKRSPRWCWAVMLLLAAGVLPGAALVLATDPPAPSSAKVSAKPPVAATSVEERLSRQISVRLTDVPLHEALAVISKEIDLPIEIDAEDIAIEGVTPQQAVTLTIEETSADNALRLLLETHNLRYSLENYKVIVSGVSSAPMIIVVYDIADLLKQDLNRLDKPEVTELTQKSRSLRAAKTLADSIVEQVKPESWSDSGGRGEIEVFPTDQSLVVWQTEPVHRKIGNFLVAARKRVGVSAEISQKPPIYLLRKKDKEPGQNVSFYPKVYFVADLVLPIPSAVREPNESRSGLSPDSKVADFDTLIQLITSSIEPDTWDKVGGPGAIEAFPTNLSLVISQSAIVHAHIADLLEQLRRLQDVQITIETRLLQVPKSFLPLNELPGFIVRDSSELEGRVIENVDKPIRLSPTTTVALLQAVEQNAESNIVAAPKITLFNGQHAQILGLVKSTLQYEATRSADHQFVFLKVASDADTQLDESVSETIGSGGSLLLRIDESNVVAWNPEPATGSGFLYLQKIPYFSRLFQNTPPPMEHIQLLLVTPKVIVVGE